MGLNLHHLSCFHAVAEAGGVSRGADALMISQPAVTKQVKALERAVGCALLEKEGRGVRLTEAGRTLASYAKNIFALAGEAETALSDVSGMRRGTLRIGVTPTIGTYLLPEALVYFGRRFPGIRVELETADGAILSAQLAEGAIEMALGDDTVSFAGMSRRRFSTAKFVAVVAPNHPLARGRRITLEAFATSILIARKSSSAAGPSVFGLLADAGIAANSSLTFGSTEAVKRAAELGLGVGIVPAISVTREIESKRLQILDVRDFKLERPLFEIWHGQRTRSKAARAFHCVIDHAARGTLPKTR